MNLYKEVLPPNQVWDTKTACFNDLYPIFDVFVLIYGFGGFPKMAVGP